MRLLKRFLTALCIWAAALIVPHAAAQSPGTADSDAGPNGDEASDEPLLENLRGDLKSEYFQLGVLVQGVADFQPERPGGVNGFRLAKARLQAKGTLDGGWGYKLQSDFTREVALLDALVSYQPVDWLGAQAGLFKAPFSYEYLVSASRVKFVGRPQVIGALAPKRHVGVSVAVAPVAGVNVQGGIFNGNGRTAAVNDNNQFLYVGRLTATPQGPFDALTLGASVAYNDMSDLYERADGTVLYAGDASAPNDADAVGSTFLLGGDAHLEAGPWEVGAEAIYGRFDEHGSSDTDQRPFGHYVTVGYDLPTRLSQQILLRWDSFTPDADEAPGSDLLIAGYNLWPTSIVQVQFNYVVPVREAAFVTHRVRADIQIAW